MDKLAYHYNKKKLPGKTPGTFLYYYPCKRREQANARLEDKSYIVLEVSSWQWEMLIELDRLEYNSNHNYSRHTVRMPEWDEDAMPHAMREQHIDKGIPFTYFIHENQDKNKLYSALSEKERTVLRLCEEEDYTQAEAARELRVSQGYISRLLKRARKKRFYLKNKNASRDEIIWNYWQYFLIRRDIPSPMKKVVLPAYQTKKGEAITKDEEARLVNYCKSHKNVEGTDALLVLLYFGLRKSELKTIQVLDGKWLQCETSKERLGQNVVLRKIPFTTMARKVLPYIDFERAKHTNLNTISTRMKRLLPNHHPHELRHTFISRCKESGVTSEVVSIWAGHSLSGTITSTVYTHYSEEFQLKEAEKVVY